MFFLYDNQQYIKQIKKKLILCQFLSTQHRVQWLLLKLIVSTACQFVSKPVDFIASSWGRLKLNLTVCNKILMIHIAVNGVQTHNFSGDRH
jgi:hypothetical protein